MTLVTQYPINAIAARLTATTAQPGPERHLSRDQIDEWCRQNPERLRRPKVKGAKKETVLPSMAEMHEKRRKFAKMIKGGTSG
jgi:hypothetical protein